MGKEPSGFSKEKRLGWGRTEDRAPTGAVAAEMKVACTKAVTMQAGRSGQAGELQGVKSTQGESQGRYLVSSQDT